MPHKFFKSLKKLFKPALSKRSDLDYRELFENAHDAILIMDPKTETIIAVNQRACEIYGYTREELKGSPLTAIWVNPEHDRKLIRHTLEQAVYAGFESLRRRKDGKKILVEINTALIPYRGRKAILMIQRDISDRRFLQELRLSHDILSQIGSLVIVANAAGHIIFVNRVAQTMLGYSPKELLGQGWWELARADRTEREKEIKYTMLSAQGKIAVRSAPYERCVRKRNGTECWILWNDAKGAGDVVVGVGHDISDRKRAERGLKESEERYRFLFESTPVPILIYDPEKLIFLAVNEAAVRQYGYSREEFLHMTIDAIGPRDDIPVLMKDSPDSEMSENRGNVRHRKKDGAVFEVSLISRELFFGMRKVRLILPTDVSGIRRAELTELKLRTQKNRLASVVDAVEKDRRRISKELHDGLGQLITAAKRNLEMLAQDPSTSENAAVQFQRIESILNEALLEAKGMAHDLTPRILEDLGLVVAIQSLCDQCSHDGKIEIDFKPFEFNAPLKMSAALAIYRLLQEAVTNVLQHAAATEISIQLIQYPSRLVLSVEDNGCGFDMRNAKSRPLQARGAGILSMRERVEFLNGNFNIDSSPGNGTTILAEIPLTNDLMESVSDGEN